MTEYKLNLNSKSLKEDEPVKAEINGKVFSVFLHAGKIHVLDGTCTHEGGPLYDGSIDNNELICPWHSGAYAVDTGKASENTPWVTDITAYETKIDKDTGEISIEM